VIVVPAQQTRESWNLNYLCSALGLQETYSPEFYKLIRLTIPPLAAAVRKLTLLCGDLEPTGPDPLVEDLTRWMQTVGANRVERGFNVWENADCRDLLTFGRAAGEIVLTNDRKDIYRLVNVEPPTLRLIPNAQTGEIEIGQAQAAGQIVMLDRALTTYEVHQSEGGDPRGTSLFSGLQFPAEIVLTIEHAVKRNWERIGAPGFLLAIEPGANWGGNKDTAQGIADAVLTKWNEAQAARRQGKIQDFSFVGNLKVITIGADGQVLDMEVPYRALMEQLIAQTDLPPWMFGFAWSTTERMSSTQAEMLVATIEGLRSERQSALLYVLELRQKLVGLPFEEIEWKWSNVTLTDMLDEARARQTHAQAHKVEIENAAAAWRNGWIDQVAAAQGAGYDIEEPATPMGTPPAPAPVGPAGLSALVKPMAACTCGEVHSKSDWGQVTYGSDEEPNDERIKKLIDSFYGDLRRSAQKLQDRVEQALRPWFPAQESKAVTKDAAEDLTRAQMNALTDAFETHFREVAGMKRDQEGFVSPTTGDGIIQDYYLTGMSLGVLRANEATGTGSANVLIARDANSVQSFMTNAFERLSDQGALRLEDILPQVKDIIKQGIDLGENPLEIARQLSARFDQYKGWEFERLVRTEVAFAQNAGFVAECEAEGVDCSRIDASAVPAHPNCLLGSTPCEAPGGIVAGLRAWYDGQAIEFTFAHAGRLAITENHLLLTRNGFVPAKALHEGDDVIYCPSFEGTALSRPDNDHGPACIEDIVNALAESLGGYSAGVPVASEDLHGDGNFVHGNVNIVGADGFTERDGDTSLLQHGSKGNVEGGGVTSLPLFAEGTLAEVLLRAAHTADSLMSRYGDSVGVSRFGTRIDESDGLALRSQGDSSLTEKPVNDLTADAQALGELVDRFSEQIAFDKIIGVRKFNFRGHVYDLQTFATVYLANGVVSSNCQCTTSIAEINGRLTLIYEVAANACDKCLAIKATNPV
jgi:hypothetical protein